MTDDVVNVMLEHCRATRASQMSMELDIADLKTRVSNVGQSMGAMTMWLDRRATRVGRFEWRQDLVDAD